MSADGTKVVGTDHAVNIERYIGSDFADTLHGAPGTSIDGGGGNDTLYSNGSNLTGGGAGDDLIYVTLNPDTANNTSFDGGGGNDTLDTRMVTDARWSIRLSGAIGTSFMGFEAKYSGGLGSDPTTTGEVIPNGVNGNLNGIDVIYLGAFADEVYLDGSETVTVFGGAGDDNLRRMTPNDGTATVAFYGQSGDDHIELHTGGQVYGGSGNDDFAVNASGDGHMVNGGRGDDFMTVARMNGTIDGGAGHDVVSFDLQFTTTVNNHVDLAARTFQNLRYQSGFAYHDVTGTIRNVEQLIGDNETRDEFYGRGHVGEQFSGRGGDDMLVGRGGNDLLYGGTGNDDLEGGKGNDLLNGGIGGDTLNGGAGNDTVSYANAAPDGDRGELVASGFGDVTVNLAAGTATGAMGSDFLVGIENVIGGHGNDTLIGDDGRNALSGGGGDDLLQGAGGPDVLLLGEGNDTAMGDRGPDRIVIGLGNATIDGGGGEDLLDLGTATGKITVDFRDDSYSARLQTPVPVWNDSGTNEVRSFNGEMLTPQLVLETRPSFSNSADDPTRTLPDNSDPLHDQFAIKTIQMPVHYLGTFTNVETVLGGASVTRIIVSNGIDSYDGSGAGTDILDLSGFNKGVLFNLATGASNNARLMGDALTGIDGIDGTRFDDQLTGDASANTLNGDNGNDWLYGRGGADTISGGQGGDRLDGGNDNDTLTGNAGDDKLFGRAGLDSLDGGGGNDTLTGDAGADKLFGRAGLDRLNGGSGNDTINGAADADSLLGGAGNDALNGGKGSDILNGGKGNDLLDGGDGNDRFVFAGNFGNDTITHFAAGDAEKIDLSGVSAIASFAGLVANHLQTDAGTGYALIVAGTNSILLDHVTVSEIGVGHAYSAGDFII